MSTNLLCLDLDIKYFDICDFCILDKLEDGAVN